MDIYKYNDNELLSYVEESDEDARDVLLEKYRPYIVNSAKKIYKLYGGNGLDVNDFIQEGLIGLVNAINKYDSSLDISFYTYARKCIDTSLATYIVKYNRNKNKALNNSISLDKLLEENERLENRIVKDYRENPEELLVSFESQNMIIDRLRKELSDREMEVFDLRLLGHKYKDIAILLDRNKKEVDNAIQRIKLKLKKVTLEIESQ